jgi:hypothetical protein
MISPARDLWRLGDIFGGSADIFGGSAVVR